MKTTDFPNDWILPDEFTFGPNGRYKTLRIGSIKSRSHSIDLDEEEIKAIHKLRNLLAEERQRHLPPLFWCIGKPKEMEWDEWMKRFPKYELRYEGIGV